MTQDGYIKVASVSDIPDGEMKAYRAPDGVEVAVCNIGGTFYAIANMCTHEDASLHFGWLHAEACEVECPLHEGRFDLRTGEAVAPPPEYPAKIYNVRVEGDDVLVGPAKT